MGSPFDFGSPQSAVIIRKRSPGAGHEACSRTGWRTETAGSVLSAPDTGRDQDPTTGPHITARRRKEIGMAAVSRRDFLKTAGAIGVGAAAGIGFPAVLRAQGGGSVKVGVLHSLSGTMAISEVSLRDVCMMAFEEINARGGVMGKKIEPVVVDPASNWDLFAEKAKQLLLQDKVAVTCGCWTSVSRKSVLPVFENNNGLLFYPVQYEGEECSKNVFYTGACPNQQLIPAVDYLMKDIGVKRWVLAGTDYVYPRTTNKILEAYLKAKGVKQEDIMINYTPFGHSDWQTIVANIKKFGSAGKKTAVVYTINGDANVPFYNELDNQKISAEDIPVVAFS